MPRTIQLPIGGDRTLTLIIPVSARTAMTALHEYDSWLEAERAGHPNAGSDLAACAAVLRLADPDRTCPVIDRWRAGAYAEHADDIGTAALDLLAWCEAEGVYLADLHAGVLACRAKATGINEVLLEEVRGNWRRTASTAPSST